MAIRFFYGLLLFFFLNAPAIADDTGWIPINDAAHGKIKVYYQLGHRNSYVKVKFMNLDKHRSAKIKYQIRAEVFRDASQAWEPMATNFGLEIIVGRNNEMLRDWEPTYASGYRNIAVDIIDVEFRN